MLVACAEQRGPAIASEVIIYDPFALTTQSTGRALSAAQKVGLAMSWGGGVWVPTTLAYDLKYALEEVALRYQDEGFLDV